MSLYSGNSLFLWILKNFKNLEIEFYVSVSMRSCPKVGLGQYFLHSWDINLLKRNKQNRSQIFWVQINKAKMENPLIFFYPYKILELQHSLDNMEMKHDGQDGCGE